MLKQNLTVAFTALFIMGMIWLRTRMQYAKRGGAPLELGPAGRIYFGSVLGTLMIGWLTAPVLGHVLWPVNGVTPTLTRVAWFLGTYYVFIIVHRVLKRRGSAVFRHRETLLP